MLFGYSQNDMNLKDNDTIELCGPENISIIVLRDCTIFG